MAAGDHEGVEGWAGGQASGEAAGRIGFLSRKAFSFGSCGHPTTPRAGPSCFSSSGPTIPATDGMASKRKSTHMSQNVPADHFKRRVTYCCERDLFCLNSKNWHSQPAMHILWSALSLPSSRLCQAYGSFVTRGGTCAAVRVTGDPVDPYQRLVADIIGDLPGIAFAAAVSAAGFIMLLQPRPRGDRRRPVSQC